MIISGRENPPANPPEQITRLEKPAPSTAINRTFTKILLVDDSKFLADVLALFFSYDGYVARAAYGGEEAIAAVEDDVPDIAFIDLDMPRVNGLELARHIRRSHRAKNMVLVALSGWEDKQFIADAADAGFDHFLAKPVDPPTLRQFMQHIAGEIHQSTRPTR